jgi:hypothetical protein
MVYNSMGKPLDPSGEMPAGNPKETDLDIEINLEPEDIEVEGSMEIEIEDSPLQAEMGDFDQNLAEVIPDSAMSLMSQDLVNFYDSDKESRKDWEKGVAKGLELLGIKTEDRQEPWPGASGVFHPVLAETAMQFQAHAIMELFPASGPARTMVFGEQSEEMLEKAARVEEEINYQITQKMTEYRVETEQLLYRLALVGSAFKKVYMDPNRGRPVSMFVPADDFIAPYGASDLASCERYTHVMRRSTNELKKLMKRGFYREVDLQSPAPEFTDTGEKINSLAGEAPSIEVYDRHLILEVHAELDLSEYGFDDPESEKGCACPYIVTIEYSSGNVLSVRRNWDEEDDLRLKRVHFVHYQYLPGLGFYGNGLFHIIGGLAKSATSILRQLIDNGTLSNLPAGFKARGLRIKADDTPIRPGEFRDVDAPGNSIRDSIMPLPIKEPSAVLLELLRGVTEEARRVGSVPDMNISDMREGMPVGTMLAVMERSLKVMSAVQARLHAALRQELGLIANIIAGMPGGYEYGEGEEYDRGADFADRIRIVPVSDPNAATSAQRVIQYQTVLQLAAQQPTLYDMPKLHRKMLDYIGIKDAEDLVKTDDDHTPMDPVSENMAIITGKPVKAFQYQDHESHIAVHMAAAQDPNINALVGQAPNAQAIMGAMSAHILEHLAMRYRKGIEDNLGTQLPSEKTKLPPDVEVQLSALVAQAAQKLLGQSQTQKAAEAAQQAAQDPLVQMQQAQMQLKAQELQLKQGREAANTVLKAAQLKSADENAKLRIAADMAKNKQMTDAQRGSKAADVVLDMANALKPKEPPQEPQ